MTAGSMEELQETLESHSKHGGGSIMMRGGFCAAGRLEEKLTETAEVLRFFFHYLPDNNPQHTAAMERVRSKHIHLLKVQSKYRSKSN